jgi:hypothetical protein
MSLHSRIQVAGQSDEPETTEAKEAAERASVVADPFAELKSRVHHEVITRLGPRLFSNASGDAPVLLMNGFDHLPADTSTGSCLPPDAARRMREESDGQFVGIGAHDNIVALANLPPQQ